MSKTREFAFDPNKPYSTVRGDPRARYIQDYKFFDVNKRYCGDVPPAFVPKGTPAPSKVQQQKTPAERDAERLEKAIGKLGPHGKAAPPQKIADAYKENAAAVAAEERALI